MGRTSSQLTGVLLVVGFLAALHTVGLRASTLGLALACVALAACAMGRLRIVRAPIDALLLTLSAWVVLVTVPHLGVWESAFQLTVFLLLPLSFLAVRRMDASDIERLLDAVVLILASLGAAALLYGIGGETQSPIFPNRNNQAALLNMGALLAAGMTFAARTRRLRQHGLLAATVVLVAGASLAGSRGALLGLGAGMIVAAIVARHRIRHWCLYVAAPVALGWVVAAVASAGRVLARAGTLAQPDVLQNVRLGPWHTTLQLIGDAPWFGHGLGLTHWVWLHALVPDSTLGVYPHNDYLQYALEAGIPAALLVAALVAGIILVALQRPSPDAPSHLTIGGAAAIAALAVHAGVSYHLQLAPHLLMFGVLAAAVAHTAPGQAVALRESRWARWAVLGVLLLHASLLSAYGLVMPHHRIPLNLKMQTYLEYDHAPSPAELHRLSVATRLQPHATEAHLALASALWAACRESGTAEDCARSRAQVEVAARRNPHSYEAVYLRGKYSGDLNDVLRAIDMNPRLSAARLEAADMLEARGDADAAFTVLRQGLRYLQRPWSGDFGYLERTGAMAESRGRTDVVAEVARIRDRIGRRLPPDRATASDG